MQIMRNTRPDNNSQGNRKEFEHVINHATFTSTWSGKMYSNDARLKKWKRE